MARDCFIGLISGTSSDGVDAVLAEFMPAPRLIASHFLAYPEALRLELLEFAAGRYRGDPIDQLGRLDCALGELFAQAALAVLKQSRLSGRDVRAIGSHGQTVRHRARGPQAFTLQIADPNIMAARTGIATVADFRRRDLALGGEGAPLVPAFHRTAFADRSDTRAVVNIGGIANLTLLPAADGPVSGFDTGPGNVLMDSWSRAQLHAPHDEAGKLAASGKVHTALLADWLDDEYFRRPPPKSTGREHFSEAWLQTKLAGYKLSAADVMATLCELTARSIADAVGACKPRVARVLVCGGGIHNRSLMQRLVALLADRKIGSTADYGVDPDWVEAMAFAWLARETLAGRPGNLPAVTGARQPAVLGGIYPA
ncbi:MAG: anhydro-N-acetylmuramic acid kinase [Gammaproteobacteria bacterium]|nr:anhydro-N-acetylmuramic acid kinase [Gammaproteobacteria bacterium]MBU6509227.1 anhydro-N-acetylmuramic acid kinase [Gammaproteobacteria bacterium]MDE1983771.1 anhydro-N-acetylmuramic acid kinase [Gammaproteobacteria bacterium]MDE2107893.1 anhydro-N-acetylmuramic acid kinase [Gammaproteobacteria bacterium]MDE2459814.1 anhydro-N-acetylmuramic acid kinase [Gammaproteobacteria bacterium]